MHKGVAWVAQGQSDRLKNASRRFDLPDSETARGCVYREDQKVYVQVGIITPLCGWYPGPWDKASLDSYYG